MKIYIVERNNPERWMEPEVYLDGKEAIEDILKEYQSQLEVLDDYSCIGSYWMIDEEKYCGDCLIERETDGDQWQWRLTEHLI